MKEVWWHGEAASALGRDELIAAYGRITAKWPVVERVPPDAVRILDVGCANGATGAELKRRCNDRRVTGIEVFDGAAALAARVVDEVVVADVLDLPDDQFAAGLFDCVICADVLEHLPTPRLALAKLRRWTAAGGTLIVSIPNVAHYSVIAGLLRGRWDYGDEGILDRSHLRFFGLENATDLIESAGFTVEDVAGDASTLLRGWRRPLLRSPFRRFLDSGYFITARAAK